MMGSKRICMLRTSNGFNQLVKNGLFKMRESRAGYKKMFLNCMSYKKNRYSDNQLHNHVLW